MQLLLDVSPNTMVDVMAGSCAQCVLGQLLTPLSAYAFWGGAYAIDNGAFSGFDRAAFDQLITKMKPHRQQCLFVAIPDVVANARRTLEVFQNIACDYMAWPLALVAQDGIEDLAIPWRDFSAIFIGGTTDWKLSLCAADIIRAARILGKHTHVGRVNTRGRWKHFEQLGVDTCDGTGFSRFRDGKFLWLRDINKMPLWDGVSGMDHCEGGV